MCGIAGCIGHERSIEYVASSLETLEYRGYDSMGIAYPNASGNITAIKSIGGISALHAHLLENPTEESPTLAIGHSRWATHGKVSIPNAHPHTNANSTIAVVHNGTIENYLDLKSELKDDGYNFVSETDTEIIPHLLDRFISNGAEPDEAFAKTLQMLSGAYAVLAFFANTPNTLYAGRLSSPLVLGVNGHEQFAASDPSVIIDQTKKAVFLDDYEIAVLRPNSYQTHHLKKGQSTTRKPQELDATWEKAVLGEYETFMLKEIYDSPEVMRAAISGRITKGSGLVRLGGLETIREDLRNIKRLVIVACGSSYHAGLVGERLIEEIASLPVEVQLASEFIYKNEPLDNQTALLAISQSGETADTIAAINKSINNGLLALGINNSPGSTIDRITTAGIHCRAGREISVASTKAFTSQVAVLAQTAIFLAEKSNPLRQQFIDELATLPEKIETILDNTDRIQELAKKYSKYSNFLFIGRGYGQISALEGALKLKEISYIHAEGCGAGEMKHGTLALIDQDFPTLAIATNSESLNKTLSNVSEIKSRNGLVIGLISEDMPEIAQHFDDVIYVPATMEQTAPILNGIVLQLFAYYVAKQRGHNIDQPRNLAKSVTVE